MHGLGLPFGEFWGMSEIGVITLTDPGAGDIGTVGRPLPGCEVKIAAEAGPAGEVLVRTGIASRGYRNRPQETAAMFAADGWIRTGDLGRLDEQGRLRIVGRLKEVIITSDGHNTAPAPIESELVGACPLVAQACLVGDGGPYLAVLITLQVARWLAAQAGPAGQVVATDTNPRFLADAEKTGVEVRRHDILADPLEPGRYDLVHCRALLLHLTDPRQAVRNMAAAVRPGGWLLIEDADYISLVAANPAHPRAARFDQTVRTLSTFFAASGALDPYLGRCLPSLVTAAGLAEAGSEAIACHRRAAAGRPSCYAAHSNG